MRGRRGGGRIARHPTRLKPGLQRQARHRRRPHGSGCVAAAPPPLPAGGACVDGGGDTCVNGGGDRIAEALTGLMTLIGAAVVR